MDDLRERASLAAMRAYGVREYDIGNVLTECRDRIEALEGRIADTQDGLPVQEHQFQQMVRDGIDAELDNLEVLTGRSREEVKRLAVEALQKARGA